jgi:hypothetical protein
MRQTLRTLGLAVAGLAAAVSITSAVEIHINYIGPNSNGNLTITWNSESNAYYTVYYSDVLADWTIWRIAAARIPSGGPTTSWVDESVEAQMAAAPLAAAAAEGRAEDD